MIQHDTQFTLKLPKQLLKELQICSKVYHQSPSCTVRKAIVRYLQLVKQGRGKFII